MLFWSFPEQAASYHNITFCHSKGKQNLTMTRKQPFQFQQGDICLLVLPMSLIIFCDWSEANLTKVTSVT